MSEPYIFDHEGVTSVTITDDEGVERTYVDGEAIAIRMLDRLQAAIPGLLLGAIMAQEGGDGEAIQSIMNMGNNEGQTDAYMFIAGFNRHLADVSVRLRAGLPAHEGDTLDDEGIDALTAAFAEALADVEVPDDLNP